MSNIEQKDIKMWSRMGPRAMFGQFMMQLAETNKDLIVLSADLGRSSGLDRFKKLYPDQYLSVGISEQNLVGVASGLAKEGHKVFVTSFAPFLSMRASEQVRMNLGYMELGVNLVALGSGLSMAYLGNSHFGLEDVAIMRSIPNINVSSPADCLELMKTIQDYTQNERGPSYIRLTGIAGSEPVYEKDFNYSFGRFISLKKGKDIAVVATGAVISEVKKALEILEQKGLSIELININTIKPLDENLIKKLEDFPLVFVIEEHTRIGGLYSSICEKMAPKLKKPAIYSIALPDCFGPTGTYKYLLDYHGLTGDKIAAKLISIV